jgi:hypothetical protein
LTAAGLPCRGPGRARKPSIETCGSCLLCWFFWFSWRCCRLSPLLKTDLYHCIRWHSPRHETASQAHWEQSSQISCCVRESEKVFDKPWTNLCIVTDCTEFVPLDSAKDSLPHVGFCGRSWTWLLRYQTDCDEHRCWHYFIATWAFARLSMAWEQVAVKWGLPATVRWRGGGNPPQHVGLDKLLRDHQPGDSIFVPFLKQKGTRQIILWHKTSQALSSQCQHMIHTLNSNKYQQVGWSIQFHCFGLQRFDRILNWWFERSTWCRIAGEGSVTVITHPGAWRPIFCHRFSCVSLRPFETKAM